MTGGLDWCVQLVFFIFIQSFAAGDPDLWDDRELIRAYDQAIRNWRREDKGKGASEETPGPGPWMEVSEDAQPTAAVADPSQQLSAAELIEVGSWIIGAPCRALYSEDGLEYEAKIVGIQGPQCTVRFVGKILNFIFHGLKCLFNDPS